MRQTSSPGLYLDACHAYELEYEHRHLGAAWNAGDTRQTLHSMVCLA